LLSPSSYLFLCTRHETSLIAGWWWDAFAMQPTKMIHGFCFVPIAVARFERWTLVIACWQRRNHFTLVTE
jgi:hypothetical protein